MHQAQAVGWICYQADRLTRQELSINTIASERDYMSTLSTRIRDAWQPFGQAFAYSATLSGGVEQAFGCDTLLVVHDDQGAKLCLIEAKWPRIATRPSYRWDKQQKQKGKTSKLSHFTQQLQRQRFVIPDAVVVEMFLLELPPGTESSVLDDFGGTLILHQDAYMFDTMRRKSSNAWTNYDFWELMGFAGNRKHNLGLLVTRLAQCRLGNPLPIANGDVSITTTGGADSLRIPVTLNRLSDMAPEVCRQLGVENLISLNLSREGG